MSNPRVVEALSKLDPANENHWTADGLPRLETVRLLAGDTSLSREAVTAAAPQFHRGATLASSAPEKPAAAPVASPPPDPDTDDSGPDDDAGEQVAEGLAGDLDRLKAERETIRDEIRLAQIRMRDLNASISDLEQQIEDAKPKGDNPFTAYLARQQVILAERAEVIDAIKQSGLQIEALQRSLKSPLDTALSRKRKPTGR